MIQKNRLKIAAILAAVLILAACPTGSSTDEYKGPGKTLKLSGQVYTQEFDQTGIKFNYSKFNDNLDLSDNDIGGSGKIKNGLLSYSVGIPVLTPAGTGLALLKGMYSDINFSTLDVNAAILALSIENSDDYDLLLREKMGDPVIKWQWPPLTTPPSITFSFEIVNYVYVDRDVTVSANGDTFVFDTFIIPITLTTEDIKLKLKKGWNTLYSEITATSNIPLELLSLDTTDITITDIDLTALNPAGKLSMSLKDPSYLNWALY